MPRISTDSGVVITSDLDQPSHDLPTDASMRTTDKFIMYPSIPVIRTSTETKTSPATSVVVTPVVSELLTRYHTPGVSLHGMSDVSVTSEVIPLTYHCSEMVTVSNGNVLSGRVSSNVVIQPLTHARSINNPHP